MQLLRQGQPGDGEQMTWRLFCVGVNGTDYEQSDAFYPFDGMDEWTHDIVEYWVISDYGLTELVAQWLSQLGSVGIVGLYVTIIVSLGALLRKMVPNAWYILYMTLSDALPLLQLIDIMEICRITEYPWEHGENVIHRGHLKDEYQIWYIVMKVYRSPELLCAFTKANPTYSVLCDEDNYDIE